MRGSVYKNKEFVEMMSWFPGGTARQTCSRRRKVPPDPRFKLRPKLWQETWPLPRVRCVLAPWSVVRLVHLTLALVAVIGLLGRRSLRTVMCCSDRRSRRRRATPPSGGRSLDSFKIGHATNKKRHKLVRALWSLSWLWLWLWFFFFLLLFFFFLCVLSSCVIVFFGSCVIVFFGSCVVFFGCLFVCFCVCVCVFVCLCVCAFVCVFVFVFVPFFTRDAEACAQSTQTLHGFYTRIGRRDSSTLLRSRAFRRCPAVAASLQLSEVTRIRFVVALVNATSSSFPSVSAVTVGCLLLFGASGSAPVRVRTRAHPRWAVIKWLRALRTAMLEQAWCRFEDSLGRSVWRLLTTDHCQWEPP